MEKQKRVGIFVTLALAISVTLVFLIGENANMWSRQITYRTSFGEVSGLKPGSPVRLGGVDVGTVHAVGHKSDAADTRIYVELRIVGRESDRIRQATVARIGNKGLLGDKMVELSVPTAPSPVLDPQSPIASEDPTDFGKYIARAEEIVGRFDATIGHLEQGTRFLAEPSFSEDARSAVSSLSKVLKGVADEPSAVHKLLMDPATGADVASMVADLKATTNDLRATAGTVRSVADHVKSGNGLVHTAIYDDELGASVKSTAREVSGSLVAIREGNGLAHDVIYGGERTSKVLGNVVGMSEDLRRIVADMRAGKGTVGAMLVDPSLYDDLKGVVGNVERSAVLKALVRYSIGSDDRRKPAEGPQTAERK
jgi:phospholipid/cholesterol/gamma-HCH transport system substrate-binding protein